jgi:hypothetical protein
VNSYGLSNEYLIDLILSGGTHDASPLESRVIDKAASVSHGLMERPFGFSISHQPASSAKAARLRRPGQPEYLALQIQRTFRFLHRPDRDTVGVDHGGFQA